MNRLLICLTTGALLIGLCLVMPACISDRHLTPDPKSLKNFETTIFPPRILGDYGIEERVYPIQAVAMTNGLIGISNAFPVRVNIDLSIDDGTNYTYRLAYGIPSVSNRLWVNYDYSFPWWNLDLITESARIRVSDLAGNTLCTSWRAFQIKGIKVIAPSEGETLVNGTTYDVVWKQAGNRDYVTIGYITPTSEHVPLVTISNVLNGVNTYTWDVAGLPITNQVKIVLKSAVDSLTNSLVGYSGIVSAQ